MKKFYKKIIIFLLSSRPYRWMMRYAIPKVRFSMLYAQFTGEKFNIASSLIQPGDIILTKDPLKLTGLLIPGYDHAEFYIGKKYSGGQYEAIGMHAEGLRKSFFFDVCKETKSICILRPNVSEEIRFKFINRAIEIVKKNPEYDLIFSINPKAMYCSELIWHITGDEIEYDLSDIHSLGQKYLSPQGIRDCKGLDIIFEN